MMEVLTPKVLQNRADAIIVSLGQMVDQRMNPVLIQDLEASDPRSHRDLLQVYLGLKPAATHLEDVGFCYTSTGRNYLEMMPDNAEGDLTVLNGFEIGAPVIWNPNQELEILERNRQLAEQVVNKIPKWTFLRSLEDREGVNSIVFAASLGSLTQPYIPWEATYLAGLLVGYPKYAAENFAKYYLEASRVANLLWEEAARLGKAVKVPLPNNIREIRDNPKIRDTFIRLARATNYKDDDLIIFVLGLRAAEVPGNPFTTSGRSTSVFERRLSFLYESSGLDNKLKKFLESRT